MMNKKIILILGTLMIGIASYALYTNNDTVINNTQSNQEKDIEKSHTVNSPTKENKPQEPINTTTPEKETIVIKRETSPNINEKRAIEDAKLEQMAEKRKKLYMENFKEQKTIENIETMYVDKEKKIIRPYKEIPVSEVGWPPSDLRHFDDPIKPVTYYYAIEWHDFEDILYGIENGLIESMILEKADKKDEMIYRDCKVTPNTRNFERFSCMDGGEAPKGADGFLQVSIFDNINKITGQASYFGWAQNVVLKNGKGYIYGVYE